MQPLPANEVCGYLIQLLFKNYQVRKIMWMRSGLFKAGAFVFFTKEKRKKEKREQSRAIQIPTIRLLQLFCVDGSLVALDCDWQLFLFFLLQWDLVAKVNAKVQLLHTDDGCTKPFPLFALLLSQFSWSTAFINLCPTQTPSLQQSKWSSFIKCLKWFQKHHFRLSIWPNSSLQWR